MVSLVIRPTYTHKIDRPVAGNASAVAAPNDQHHACLGLMTKTAVAERVG